MREPTRRSVRCAAAQGRPELAVFVVVKVPCHLDGHDARVVLGELLALVDQPLHLAASHALARVPVRVRVLVAVHVRVERDVEGGAVELAREPDGHRPALGALEAPADGAARDGRPSVIIVSGGAA